MQGSSMRGGPAAGLTAEVRSDGSSRLANERAALLKHGLDGETGAARTRCAASLLSLAETPSATRCRHHPSDMSHRNYPATEALRLSIRWCPEFMQSALGLIEVLLLLWTPVKGKGNASVTTQEGFASFEHATQHHIRNQADPCALASISFLEGILATRMIGSERLAQPVRRDPALDTGTKLGSSQVRRDRLMPMRDIMPRASNILLLVHSGELSSSFGAFQHEALCWIYA